MSLAVMLWLSGAVVDRAFTSEGVDVCVQLFIDHRCVNVLIRVSNFPQFSCGGVTGRWKLLYESGILMIMEFQVCMNNQRTTSPL